MSPPWGPLDGEDLSDVRAGDIRVAFDLEDILEGQQPQHVVVLEIGDGPTPWVQALLVDTQEFTPASSDLLLPAEATELGAPMVIQADVTGPLLIAQLGPRLGRVPEPFIQWLQTAAETGVAPLEGLPEFGSHWVVDDPRREWKSRQVQVMSGLVPAALQAIVNDPIVCLDERWADVSERDLLELLQELKGQGFRSRLVADPALLSLMVGAFRHLGRHDEAKALMGVVMDAVPGIDTEDAWPWNLDGAYSEAARHRGRVAQEAVPASAHAAIRLIRDEDEADPGVVRVRRGAGRSSGVQVSSASLRELLERA